MIAVHSIGPDGRVRCDQANARQATTEAQNVTCKECLKMMALADRAKELQKIPADRWP